MAQSPAHENALTVADVMSVLSRTVANPDHPALVRVRAELTGASERRRLGFVAYDETVLAAAYLPFVLHVLPRHAGDPASWWPSESRCYPTSRINLADPGGLHGLVVLLALALGRDPGPKGLGARWSRLRGGPGRSGWSLIADEEVAFVATAYLLPERHEVQAPEVAVELDDVRALVLALRLVLSEGEASP